MFHLEPYLNAFLDGGVLITQRFWSASLMFPKQLITCQSGVGMPPGWPAGVSAEHQTQSGFHRLPTFSARSAERSRNHYSCLSFPVEKMSFSPLWGLRRRVLRPHVAEAVILRTLSRSAFLSRLRFRSLLFK